MILLLPEKHWGVIFADVFVHLMFDAVPRLEIKVLCVTLVLCPLLVSTPARCIYAEMCGRAQNFVVDTRRGFMKNSGVSHESRNPNLQAFICYPKCNTPVFLWDQVQRAQVTPRKNRLARSSGSGTKDDLSGDGRRLG